MTETAGVTVWNAATAAENLKQRIRLEFIAMFPEDQFKKLIEAEITSFMTTKDRGYVTNRTSDFHEVVSKYLEEITKEELRKVLLSPEWQGVIGSDGERVSEAMSKIIAEKGPEIMLNTFRNTLQNAIQNAAYHIDRR